MWAKFDGTARSRDDTLERIRSLTWNTWKPSGITLHNTAMPTLAMWAESGPSHDARIRNLENFYENELGWHAGPQWFVSRNWINWFSDPLASGIHSRCWNSTRFGIEMVGDFAIEEFNSGDGAMVRDNAVFLMAALNNKFGFKPEDLTFHKECKLDNHDCPGRKVVKADVIARVSAKMAELKGLPAPPPPILPALADRLIVTADGLNLRRGPAATFQTRGLLPKGTVLDLLGEHEGWFSVRTPAGFEGWVSGKFVVPTSGAVTTPSVPPATSRKKLFEVSGKMSTFGGPNDLGMSSTEGLALFQSVAEMEQYGIWVLSPQIAGAVGLGRRLDPSQFYLACRWNTATYPKLRDAVAHVTAKGMTIQARPVDWGPNINTGRVADLSPGLARALGLATDDTCSIVVYEDGK